MKFEVKGRFQNFESEMDPQFAALFRPKRAQVEPQYVKKHLFNNSDENGVRGGECAIFLDLTGKGAYFKNSPAWEHFRHNELVGCQPWFIQYLLLLMETGSEGQARPLFSAKEDSQNYFKTVNLKARSELNILKTSFEPVLRALLVKDRKFEVGFHQDVEKEKLRLAEEIRQKQAQSKGKGKMNLTEMLVSTTTGSSVPTAPAKLTFDSDVENAGFWRKGDTRPTFEKPDSRIAEGIFRQILRNKRAQEVALEMVPAAGGSAAGGVPASAGSARAPKIQMTATPMFHTERPDEIVGYIVRFLFLDESICPGRFHETIRANLQKRMRNIREHRELFPDYAAFYNTDHPAGKFFSDHKYVSMCQQYVSGEQPVQRADPSSILLTDRTGPWHLRNVLTLARALEHAKKAGAKTYDVHEWWNPATQTAHFPVQTYKYIEPYWYNLHYCGLSEQLFPHVDMSSDFVAALVEGGDFESFLEYGNVVEEELRKDVSKVLTEQQYYLDNNWNVERAKVVPKLLPYDTYNEFMLRGAVAERIYKRIKEHRIAKPEDLYEKVQDALKTYGGEEGWEEFLEPEDQEQLRLYRRYAEILRLSQQSCLRSFQTIFQLEGKPDDLMIPESAKWMIRWWQEQKYPHVTREYRYWDKDMGNFGNAMLRQLKMFGCVAKILQPLLCLIVQGTLSCYSHCKSLVFHLMAYGRFDVGKTYILIKTFQKFTTIPGTVVEASSATAMADTTEKHNYDVVFVRDEVPAWKVDKREAEKHPDLVNKEKAKMTARHYGHQCFTSEKGPNGESVRWTKEIHTDHYYGSIEVTNAVLDSMEALSSRYFRIIVPQSKIPASLLAGEMAAVLDTDVQGYMRLNQFLVYVAYKCAQDGVILPEPNMALFDDMSARVRIYLEDRKAITQEKGNRNQEIMRPYAIYLVYMHAMHCTFDMPGSPCYKKKFEISDMIHVQRYLYCNMEIFWWVWTALAPNWIEEKNSAVLQAACIVATGKEWPLEQTNYQIYESDIRNQVPWKQYDNPNADIPNSADAKMIDINYISLSGGLDTICRKISVHCNLGHNEVEGALRVMAGMHIPVPRGSGYVPQPKASMKKWHKFTRLPKGNDEGLKDIDVHANTLPDEYKLPGETDFSKMREEKHMPMKPANATLQVVDMTRLVRDGEISILPNAMSLFSNRLIIEALEYATMSSSFPVGKLLLGLPSDLNHMDLRTEHYDAQEIKEAVKDLDDNYFDEKGRFLGDSNMPEEERPISRTRGIVINRLGNISKENAAFFNRVPSIPIADDQEDDWKRKREQATDNLEEDRILVEDLDYYAARSQHLACGLPMEEPIMTPKAIRERTEEALRAQQKPLHEGINYPDHSNEEFHKKVWQVNIYRVPEDKFKRHAERVSKRQDKRMREERVVLEKFEEKNKQLKRAEATEETTSSVAATPAVAPAEFVRPAQPPSTKTRKNGADHVRQLLGK